MNNKTNGLVGAGMLSAVAASLCCITPILALISGASGVASVFSGLEPLRPYLIGLTFLVLAFAWYQNLKPKKEEIDCACEDGEEEKKPFLQSKTFLGLVTVFSIAMLAFPYYSGAFYPQADKQQIVLVEQSKVTEATFNVEGMTCAGCEAHVESEVNKLRGIISVKADYDNSRSYVKYDSSKVGVAKIEEAINSTGYKVTGKIKKGQ